LPQRKRVPPSEEAFSLAAKTYRDLLDEIFEEAQDNEVLLTPDAAMQKLTRAVRQLVGADEFEVDSRTERKSRTAYRDAYLYAVNCYAREYGDVRPGRSRTPAEE
jgi:hypothetical protein